ncbi:MAG TPA: hypothetical protein VL172_18725 [Kofleriaceae bacterium]|jgi:hypothetical protein|nr:hypothetical protein [Kofleriaceae bacterium]
MGEERRPDKQQVIDALVLAFSHSRAAKLVGTDALRSVIVVEYHDIVRDGTFDLQPVWELLEGQPGFEVDAVTGPLCVFKSWEDKLGLAVKPPAALESLTDKEIALAVSQCKVPAGDLKTLFQLKDEPPAKGKAAAPAREPGKKGRRPRPRWMGWVAGGIAALTLGYVGLVLYHDCNPGAPEWEHASAGDLKPLPASRAERLGSQLTATVDAAWFARSEEERKSDLGSALLAVSDRGINVLSVRGQDGVVRATAQNSCVKREPRSARCLDSRTQFWFKK